ncbi:alpha/beta fold hydrolase [Hahella sp. SMD15-11]|uniref:Alpha/beta fold hydrolase n=1 Tax=Thermohahella caldifontis TaxID=3142973 RepID=A0AB39UZE9_9GAMM
MTAAAPVLQGLYGHSIPLYTWQPEHPENARFVVQIAHGMAEHARRYDRFARHLTEQGAIVIAHDHRGHGRAATSGVYGHYGDQNGWQAVTEDVWRVHQFALQRWPQLPHFLFAHSMGSFITLSSLLEHPYQLAGLILSGSNHEPPLRVRAARQIAAFERWRQGPRGRAN